MNGAKHPLVQAYEVGALEAVLTVYIKNCVRAITAKSERCTQVYLQWAQKEEEMLSPEQVNIGRFVVESMLGINMEQEQDPSSRQRGQK